MMTTRLDHYGTSQSPPGLLYAAAKLVAARLKEFNSRKGLRRMRDLDHRILRDVGVTRADVNWALSLPWNRRAGAELQQLASRRRATPPTSTRP